MAVDLTPRGTRGAGFPKFVLKAMNGIGALMYRFGAKVQGRPLLLLTTKGAKSGQERRVTLSYFPTADERGWLIVASNGGAARHPGWYVNLAKNPEAVWVDVGGAKLRARAESLKGAERDLAWRRVVEMSPGYREYAKSTDREIPLVKLTPVA